MVEHAAFLATLVGLLCNWKQERGSVAQDQFQSFITWLTHHQFNEIRDRITSSSELQRDLASMLQNDFQGFDAKLDVLTSMLASVASRMDGFAQVTQTLSVASDAISDQAAAILCTFVQSGAHELLMLETQDKTVFVLLPGGGNFSVSDERFLNDDLETLLGTGFLTVSRYDNRGKPVYALTRSGVKWITEKLES